MLVIFLNSPLVIACSIRDNEARSRPAEVASLVAQPSDFDSGAKLSCGFGACAAACEQGRTVARKIAARFRSMIETPSNFHRPASGTLSRPLKFHEEHVG